MFRLDVDAGGSLRALRGVPGKARTKDAGIDVTKLAVGPSAAALWVGGTMSSTTDGAWLHAVPW